MRLVQGLHRALGLGVEDAQALEGVAQELEAHGGVVVRREDVEDAAAPRELAGAGDRVFAPIAALVEGLQEDLGGHLFARAQAHHAGLEQVGSQDGAEEARRARPRGRGAPRAAR